MPLSRRILVLSHAHPDFSLGGGEIAAYNLFRAFQGHDGVEEAFFLARADRGRGPTGLISRRRDNEYLWEQSTGDWHRLKAGNESSVSEGFVDLLRELQPTVVIAHHYMHLGIEVLKAVKNALPGVRLVLTLHEYLAICRNDGQMIKSGSKRLCDRSSEDDCHACFPDISAEDFWLRKHYLQYFLGYVDHFVSPSNFLRSRYLDWGLKDRPFSVIENGQNAAPGLPPRPLANGQTRNRFGYFGQINPYKGLDRVLEDLSKLKKSERRRIVLEVHGANLDKQPPEFRDRIQALADPLIKEGVLEWIGPYQPNELRQRMAGVDWVIVPSIWWENSPMVIQEAYTSGRPLLVTGIGGMAEKVRDGVDGIHVPYGSASFWSEALLRVAGYTEQWDTMRAAIRRPLDHAQSAERYLELVDSIVGQASPQVLEEA